MGDKIFERNIPSDERKWSAYRLLWRLAAQILHIGIVAFAGISAATKWP
jgi:hypothetical protein